MIPREFALTFTSIPHTEPYCSCLPSVTYSTVAISHTLLFVKTNSSTLRARNQLIIHELQCNVHVGALDSYSDFT
jgi:hypothetical protein